MCSIAQGAVDVVTLFSRGRVHAQTSTRGYTSQLAASPGTGTGRRRFRSGGGGVDAGLTQDECLSPLHMLGEAAASESLGDMVRY